MSSNNYEETYSPSLEEFRTESEKQTYTETCIDRISSYLIHNAHVQKEDILTQVVDAKILYWVYSVIFTLEFHKEITLYKGSITPSPQMIRVTSLKDLEEKTDDFFFMEKERVETIEDLEKEIAEFIPSKSYRSKLFRTHPMQAVWERECSTCEGVGKVICSCCTGRGEIICTSCHGDGEVQCRSCSGKGRVVCSTCNGSSRVECSSWGCRGGRVTCSSCGGQGSFQRTNNGNIEYSSCYSCGGSGYNRCMSCGGQGSVPCNRCSGGYVTCGSCGGRGKVTCGHCHGEKTITCPVCAGHKYVTCTACDGTGSIHSIGSATTTFSTTDQLELPETFFNPHNFYASSYACVATIPDHKGKKITKIFTNSVPFCSLSIRPYNGDPHTVTFHGRKPSIHDMGNLLEIFVTKWVDSFATQSKKVELYSKHFVKNMTTTLTEFLDIPAVEEALAPNAHSEQQQKIQTDIKGHIQKVFIHFSLRGMMVYYPLLVLFDILFSQFALYEHFFGKESFIIQRYIFFAFSLCLGLCIAGVSRGLAKSWVKKTNTSLYKWFTSSRTTYGIMTTLLLLLGGAIIAFILPLGI